MPTATEKSRHGRFYWCIRSRQSEDGEIYIYADKLDVSPEGSLVAWRTPEGEPPHVNLALAAGQWTCAFMAHVNDGSAVTIERWKGEVVESIEQRARTRCTLSAGAPPMLSRGRSADTEHTRDGAPLGYGAPSGEVAGE
jgi:hypothetical protein